MLFTDSFNNYENWDFKLKTNQDQYITDIFTLFSITT